MKTKKVTRRAFLKLCGVGLGATAVIAVEGCSQRSTPAQEANVETPTYVFGQESGASGKILVGYATRTGSTVGVAATIGETLAARGYAVDVKPLKDAPALDGYRAVVLGSAVNGGQWLPEAVSFVEGQQQALNRIPVALFCVHIMNLGDDESSIKKRLAYLDAQRGLVTPVGEAFFAGMGMNAETASGFERWIYRTFNIGPEGDCRDWDKIRAWAKTLVL